MTMTSKPTDEDYILLLECGHCLQRTLVRPSGARLELLTNGLMILRFFCLHCYELNVGKVSDVDFAEQISGMGVPTVLVQVPAEVLEHPGEYLPPISEAAAEKWARTPLEYLNRAIRKELGR